MVSFESVKKMMGWCPQERVVCDHNDVFFSENTYRTDTAAYDRNNQYMDIPVQMFDWRIFAVMFGSIGLLLFGIQRSDTYLILLSLLLYALLFILDRTKISVEGGVLRIKFPVLGEKLISKSSIDKVKSGENYAKKHRTRTLIILALFFLMSLSCISNISVMYVVSTLLMVYVMHSTIRISHYSESIVIRSNGWNISLYPRNEHDFLMLKSIAPEKIEQQGAK
jgi:hypothetical protein